MKTKQALESSLELPFSVNIVRAHRTAARRQHGRTAAPLHHRLLSLQLEAEGPNPEGGEKDQAEGNIC